MASTSVESNSHSGNGPALGEKKHWATALYEIKSELSRIRNLDLTEFELQELQNRFDESTIGFIKNQPKRSRSKETRKETSLQVEKIQNELYEKRITAFLREHFEAATADEAARIRRQLIREAFFPQTTYDGNDKVEALGTMLKGGLNGVRTNHRRRRLKKYGTLLWEAVKALIAAGSAVAIYAMVDDGFQTIAVSLMILIYTRVVWGGISKGMGSTFFMLATVAAYIEMKKLLGSEATLEEASFSWPYEDSRETMVVSCFLVVTRMLLLDLLAYYHLGKTIVGFLIGIH